MKSTILTIQGCHYRARLQAAPALCIRLERLNRRDGHIARPENLNTIKS